ncbi:MAG: hypothetical protein R2822_05555 [Spirosomataceae bacterium]
MNIKTKIDEWEVRDLEDGGVLKIYVEHNTEMGNRGVPGIQVWYTMQEIAICQFRAVHVEKWAYQAQKRYQTICSQIILGCVISKYTSKTAW